MGHLHEEPRSAHQRRKRGRADHLERHGAGWRVRVRRPKALVVGKLPVNLRITIGAAPYAAAARAARAVRAAADRLFAEVSGMNEEQIGRRLAAWREEMKLTVAANLLEAGRMFLTPEECAAMDSGSGLAKNAQAEPSLEVDQLMRVVAAGPWAEDRVRRALAGFRSAREELAPVREAGLRALGFETPEAQAAASALIPHVYKAWLQSLREQAPFGAGDPDALAAALSPALAPACATHRRVDGADVSTQAAEMSGCRLTGADEGARLDRTASAAHETIVEEGPETARRLFLARWDEFVKDKIDVTGEWKISRSSELASTRRIFERMCGNIRVGDLSRSLLKGWREAYLRLPHDYSEHPAFNEMSVDDLVTWSKARERNRIKNAEARAGYVRIDAGSFNKHLSSLEHPPT